MSARQRLLLFPPDKTPTGSYMLAIVKEPEGRFGGFVTDTGSTDDLRFMDINAGKTFPSSAEAISWAEANGWEVMNKALYGPRAVTAPSKMTVSVLEAGYVPWFTVHPTIEQRNEAGEKVLQMKIRFRPLDVLTQMGGCYLVIDEEADQRLRPRGIKSAADLVGHVLELRSEDPTDLFRPFRIVRIVS